jgi:chromosome segregation ATPase
VNSSTAPINKKLLLAFKECLQKVEDNSLQLKHMDTRLALTIEEMQKLSKIVYVGNGQPALTARMATLDSCLQQLKDSMHDYKREDREAFSRLQEQVEMVRKLSSELHSTLEEYAKAEKGRKKAEDDREAATRGWRGNVSQSLVVAVATGILAFLGSEMVSYYQNMKVPAKEPPSLMRK